MSCTEKLQHLAAYLSGVRDALLEPSLRGLGRVYAKRVAQLCAQSIAGDLERLAYRLEHCALGLGSTVGQERLGQRAPVTHGAVRVPQACAGRDGNDGCDSDDRMDQG